jgi:hypothetical protein
LLDWAARNVVVRPWSDRRLERLEGSNALPVIPLVDTPSIARLDGWEARRLGGWTAGRLDGWEAGRLGGWTAGRLDGWEAGRLGG